MDHCNLAILTKPPIQSYLKKNSKMADGVGLEPTNIQLQRLTSCIERPVSMVYLHNLIHKLCYKSVMLHWHIFLHFQKVSIYYYPLDLLLYGSNALPKSHTKTNLSHRSNDLNILSLDS
jgi:hypothetical protein